MERCAWCGNRDNFDWHVPDDVWEAIVPANVRSAVICLTCFDGLAERRGIAYAAHLDDALYFAGHEGIITWHRFPFREHTHTRNVGPAPPHSAEGERDETN